MISDITQTPDGALWFGTWGGLSRFDGSSWSSFTHEGADQSVGTLQVAQDSSLWVGYAAGKVGVSRYDGQTWTHYTTEDGLVDDSVTKIFKSRDGTLWFGTLSRLGWFDAKIWGSYSENILGLSDARSIKRPLNNTVPLIIQLPDRDVAIGMPGGRRIISVKARVAQKIVDYGATSFEAVDGPRIHVQTHEPVSVTHALPDNIVNGLIEMGHEITSVNGLGGGIHCAEFLKIDRTVRAGAIRGPQGATHE